MQPLQRDPAPAQGAHPRDLYCQGLHCGRSVNYSNKDFKKKKTNPKKHQLSGAETNTFLSLFRRSRRHWERQSEQNRPRARPSVPLSFFMTSFRQKRWLSRRFEFLQPTFAREIDTHDFL